jgi:hypothetical protein
MPMKVVEFSLFPAMIANLTGFSIVSGALVKAGP